MNISYKTFTSFAKEDAELRSYLSWWAYQTTQERRMLDRTPEFFYENLVFAVFAFDEEELVGAAGLIYPLDKDGGKITWQNKIIIELGSNFVLPKYREMHIAKTFTLIRLDFVQGKDFFPISVTGNIAMQKVFEGIAKPVEDLGEELQSLKGLIRDCNCQENEKPLCKVCPLADKVVWVFH